MSVYGSEAGNSAGGQDTQDEDTISQPHLQNSKLAGLFLEDEDQDYQREEASLLKGFFGVIYTVSRERIVTWRFVTFKIILDLWQLLTLTINPQYGWSFNAYDTWWQVIDIIQLNYFMSARGLTFFLVCLYIFIALLLFTLAICIWVAWSFKNQVFDYVWPITFLRWFGVIFFQMLDILSMTFFLMTLDCQYFGVDPAVIGYNQEFPSEYCWSFPYVINVVPASISLIIFVVLAAAFQMGEMELNMMTKNMLGMAHSKAEVLSFLIKFLMTSASVFLNSLEWLSCFYLGSSLLLLYLSLKWEPYYHAWVNHTRAAVNGALLYSALVLVILVYTPMLDKGGDSSKAASTLAAYKLNCTIALVAGLAPAAVLAGLCSVLRLRQIQAIVNKFRDAPPGIKNILIHKFSDVREVEMCARCCRKWVDELTYDEDAINLAYEILKAGMDQLPGNAFMIILYSSFLIDIKDGFQSGLTELAAARKADKSFLESFALYSREQLHTQKTSGASGSQGADLVSYVEQQRSYRMAMKVNKDTFEATSSFWACLLKQNVQLSALTKKVAILDARVEEATATYRHLLQRSPDNWMLIRMYGLFLELVRNDPLGAARNYAEAERIRLAEEEAKHNAFLTESTMPYDKGGRGTDNTKGVIIMNAKCIVKNINKAACDVTGYSQKELQGKNVNILIPRPFSDQHDQYVKKHITTGESTILNKDTEFVVLHKDRYVLGVTINITKLSGFGMDSIFMGVFGVLPTPPDTARAWVMGSGVVLSVDATFSDWFGYRPEDLPGAYFSTLVSDATRMEEAFLVTRNADSRFVNRQSTDATRYRRSVDKQYLDHGAQQGLNHTGSGPDSALVPLLPQNNASRVTSVKDFFIRHKFAGPVKCNVDIVNGGGARAHHFFILSITREVHRPLMVTDGKGKLLHVSKVIADDIGFTVVDLLGELADKAWDIILPEPFNSLHHSNIMGDLSPLPPPYSCRSGLSVCLLNATEEGPRPVPYRLQIKTRKQDKSEERANIVALEKVTMEQAMDERRIKVITDQNGLITKVGNTSESLFGFDPRIMVGRPLSDFVNVFQPNEVEVSKEEAIRHFQSILTELAIRSLDAPGESFRVGVNTPLSDDIIGGALLSAVSWHMHAKSTHPAVMQVRVHFGGKKPLRVATASDQQPKALGSKLPVTQNGLLGNMGGMQRPHTCATPPEILIEYSNPEDAGMTTLLEHVRGLQTPMDMRSSARSPGRLTHRAPHSPDEEMKLYHNELVVVDADSSLISDEVYLKAAGSKGEGRGLLHLMTGGQDSLLLEVDLWKADLMTGLLYIDQSGRITRTSYKDLPLYQAGCMLGVQDSGLKGLRFGDVMPEAGHAIENLFLKNFGQGIQHTSRKGGLKQERKGHDKHFSKKPGAINLVNLTHYADGQPLALTVQAVGLRQQRHEVCLILRLYKPITGINDFKTVLKENPPGCHLGVTTSAFNLSEEPGAINSVHVRRSSALSSAQGLPLTHVKHANGSNIRYDLDDIMEDSQQRYDMILDGTEVDNSEDRNGSGTDKISGRSAGFSTTAVQAELCQNPGRVPKASALPPVVDGMKTPSLLTSNRRSVEGACAAPTLEDLEEELHNDNDTMEHEVRHDSSSSSDSGSDYPKQDEGAMLASSWVMSGGQHSIVSPYSSAPKVDDAVDVEQENVTGYSSIMPMNSTGMMRQSSLLRSNRVSPLNETPSHSKHAVRKVVPSRVLSAEEEREVDNTADGGAHTADGCITMIHQKPNLLGSQKKGGVVDLRHTLPAEANQGSLDDTTPPEVPLDPIADTSADAHEADVRRGHRYKRVAKILGSDAALRGVVLFKYKAYVAIVFVAIVSVAAFIAMLLLLGDQKAGITTLSNIGRISNSFGEIYLQTLALAILFGGQGTQGLPGLQTVADIPAMLAQLDNSCNALQVNLPTTYGNVLSTVDSSNLHDIWNTPYLSIYKYSDNLKGGVISGNSQLSFWDAAKLFLSSGQNIYQNAYQHNDTKASGFTWRVWSYVDYISQNAETLFGAIYSSLDMVVQDVVASADRVNTAQLILLVLVGVICSLCATFFMFYINTQVTNMRFSLYSPFVVIPMGVVRNMVKIDMDMLMQDSNNRLKEADEEGPVRYNLMRNMTAQLDSNVSALERIKSLVRSAVFWRKQGVATSSFTSSSNRRTLVVSSRTATYMSLPFFAWGILMITTFAVGHYNLGQIAPPIAIFNLVNAVSTSYYRSLTMEMNLSSTDDLISKAAQRLSLSLMGNSLPTEYSALLYGSSGVSNISNIRFSLASQGAASPGSVGYDILYTTTECLRQNQSSCLTSNSSLFQDAMHGLDRALQAYMDAVNNTMSMKGLNPTLSDPSMYLMWNLHPDIVGGLQDLNSVYYDYVTSIYTSVLTIHIIGLSLSLALMLYFYFFMLRPFLRELTRCRRRIAYLLSTLPNDVDILGLVKRAVARTIDGGYNPDAQGGTANNSGMIGRSISGVNSMRAMSSSFKDS